MDIPEKYTPPTPEQSRRRRLLAIAVGASVAVLLLILTVTAIVTPDEDCREVSPGQVTAVSDLTMSMKSVSMHPSGTGNGDKTGAVLTIRSERTPMADIVIKGLTTSPGYRTEEFEDDWGPTELVPGGVRNFDIPAEPYSTWPVTHINKAVVCVPATD